MADVVLHGAMAPMPAPYQPSAVGGRLHPPLARNHRRDFEGNGQIVGTTKVKGSPANSPLRCHVLCMDDVTKTVVDDTWSDAATGAYTFRHLDRLRRYTTIAWDHTGAYRGVMANGQQPEAMP